MPQELKERYLEGARRGNRTATANRLARTRERIEELTRALDLGFPLQEAVFLAGWPSESAAARALRRHGGDLDVIRRLERLDRRLLHLRGRRR